MDRGELPRDEPYAATVVQRTLAYRGAIWDVVDDRVFYGNGEIQRQYIQHPGAVAVVALDADGRVLLLQQYRHPIAEREWELPAGLRDVEGEPAQQTAARELAEEADLVADTWDELITISLSPGSSSERIVIYLARDLTTTATSFERTDEEADIVKRWLPLSEALDAVRAGLVHNSIAVVGLYRADDFLARSAT